MQLICMMFKIYYKSILNVSQSRSGLNLNTFYAIARSTHSLPPVDFIKYL